MPDSYTPTHTDHRGAFHTVTDAENLTNAAIERLAEDEALRGNLADDGYLPLQTWAFDQLTRLGRDAVRAPHPREAMDQATRAVRQALQAAVDAAERGDVRALLPCLRPPLASKPAADGIQVALRALRLTHDADANALAIAAALSSDQSAAAKENGA